MQLPKGPTASPFIQVIQWIADPLKYLEKSAEMYGDCFTARWGYQPPFVIISHPQAIQELFTADFKKFEVGSANGILQPLFGSQSLILLDGESHQRQRQLLMPPFHGDRMRSYGNLICKLTEEIFSQISPGNSFLIREITQKITLRVILKAVFGIASGERFQQLERLLGESLESLSSPFSSSLLFFPFLQKDLGEWSPWGRFMSRQRKIDQLLYAEIEEKRQNPDASRTDILSMLISAVDAEGQSMSNQELRDELMTLLVAGHETTASALSWAFYWLNTLPEVKEKLMAELDSLGDNSDPNAIAKLPYLNAVCQETLRIYPVAMISFPRKLTTSLELMGRTFSAGTRFLGCIYLTHHREDIYPEPKKFKPERFLERQYNAYEYLPFGGSNRRCIGAALALYEMKLVIATVLSRYNLAMVDNRPIKPQRRGLTLAAPPGTKMIISSKREANFNKTLVKA